MTVYFPDLVQASITIGEGVKLVLWVQASITIGGGVKLVLWVQASISIGGGVKASFMGASFNNHWRRG
jgi:hypothetical protein